MKKRVFWFGQYTTLFRGMIYSISHAGYLLHQKYSFYGRDNMLYTIILAHSKTFAFMVANGKDLPIKGRGEIVRDRDRYIQIDR